MTVIAHSGISMTEDTQTGQVDLTTSAYQNVARPRRTLDGLRGDVGVPNFNGVSGNP
jgi:hypothetical protein